MNDLVPIGKKKGRPRPPGSTPASRVAILLEDIQGQVRLTMEAVTSFRAEFRREIDKLRTELSQRIDNLELAVRQNSQDIHELKADVRQNTEDIRQLKADVRQNTEDIRQLRADVRQNTEDIRSMRELLERKADHEALLKLQTRVEVVERRLGIQ
jgi:methyl-accepting chemotaxis protein